jgi:lipoprotein NlpI
LALSDFNKAIEIFPGYAWAYLNRGIAYYHMEEYDEAWEDVHKAQNLGYQVPPEFLKALREASGREE